MENIQDYKPVMHGKILNALKGRKKHIEPLPDDIIDYIFKHSQDGILFDFENITFYNGKTGLKMIHGHTPWTISGKVSVIVSHGWLVIIRENTGKN